MDSTTKLISGVIISIVAISMVLMLFPITIVETGTVGVVIRNGAINRIVEPGMRGRIPLIESVIEVNTQVQSEAVDAESMSEDMQNVSAKITVNYQIVSSDVERIYTDFRNDYSVRVVTPSVQESVKAATAKYTAEELTTKRDLVKSEIIADLKTRLLAQNIGLKDVMITNFNFSEDFNKAIENKVRAEQNALTEKNNLAAEQYKAEQRVAQAKGEAEAIRIQAQAINSQGGADYVALQKIHQWDGKSCTSYCGLDAMMMLPTK